MPRDAVACRRRWPLRHGMNLVAAVHELADDMAPDKAGRACQENALRHQAADERNPRTSWCASGGNRRMSLSAAR